MYRPNLRHLEFLAALDEEVHFGRAAERCHVTQSALSAGIKELEAGLGVSVAERTRRSVTLTPVGRELARRARDILSDARAFVDYAKSQKGALSGDFRLGAIPTLAPYLLPQVLPDIQKRYPDLRLYVREAVTDDLLDALQAGRLDAILIALPYDLGDLAVFEMFDDGYELAVPASHELAACDCLAKTDLAELEMMLLEKGHCLQRHALSAFGRNGPAQDRSFEATSLPTLVAMVAEGLGTTLLPDLAIRAGVTRGYDVKLVPLEGALPRKVALACRKHSPRKEEISRLAEVMATVVARGQRAAR
ncbi:LysR family transcriptional regulator [Roseibium aquae]|uniref:LysR family transcriptional regulator n=1 Tax=Roseibium aquae TaxID=1323746 RepID=A0A916TL58_9HYPH|nr:hydrogen peroxide-inducible genes activator [Roseibium aquae]GGB49375.1 LysR family transcriptional regulator [Roseibium aquae]